MANRDKEDKLPEFEALAASLSLYFTFPMCYFDIFSIVDNKSTVCKQPFEMCLVRNARNDRYVFHCYILVK